MAIAGAPVAQNTTPEPTYDVAISFLFADEKIASA
jgi:hypothetical protein